MLSDYGVFSRYDQSQTDHPLASEKNALCIRNASGQDFYQLRNSILSNNPQPLAWLVVNPDSRIIEVAVDTVDRVFPQDRLLVSVAPVADPSTLVGKVLGVNGAVSDAPPPPAPPVITYKADIWRRATDAEAETLDQLLASQPVRLRNLYRDATRIGHADELFPTLLDAMTQAFGASRAQELLAPSP